MVLREILDEWEAGKGSFDFYNFNQENKDRLSIPGKTPRRLEVGIWPNQLKGVSSISFSAEFNEGELDVNGIATDFLLGKARHLKYGPQDTARFNYHWDIEGFSEANSFKGVFFDETDFYVTLKGESKDTPLEIRLSPSALTIPDMEPFKRHHYQLIEAFRPDVLNLSLSYQDIQRVIRKQPKNLIGRKMASFLEALVEKAKQENEETLRLVEILSGGGDAMATLRERIRSGEGVNIQAVVTPRVLENLEKALLKPFGTEKRESYVTWMKRKYGPSRFISSQRFRDMQEILRNIPGVFSSGPNSPGIEIKSRREYMVREIKAAKLKNFSLPEGTIFDRFEISSDENEFKMSVKNSPKTGIMIHGEDSVSTKNNIVNPWNLDLQESLLEHLGVQLSR